MHSDALDCGVNQVCRAALSESECCLSPQVVIAVAEKYMRSADPSYPVGRTRLETVGVVACAVIMTIATIEVIQAAAGDLVDGFAKGVRSCWRESGDPTCGSHLGCGAAAQQQHAMLQLCCAYGYPQAQKRRRNPCEGTHEPGCLMQGSCQSYR